MHDQHKRTAILLALLITGIVAKVIHAAPLNYSADTTISLTSPAATFTITSGSVADVLTVNATSVAVTLSNTTGGSFTLSSPSYDLTIATSSGGGTVSNSCSLGLVTAVLSQTSGSTVYAITPAGQTCSTTSGGSPPPPTPAPSGSGGGGGGGGGGGSSYNSPLHPVRRLSSPRQARSACLINCSLS